MKITRETPTAVTVKSVAPGRIHIGDASYDRAIALTVDAVFESWPDKAVRDLDPSDFSELIELGPELIVLGTGESSIFPPRELVFAMARLGIGLEVMDTGAAARTFNVLAAEGREVAAVMYV